MQIVIGHSITANEQGFVSVAEIELPQFKPQMQPNSSKKVEIKNVKPQ